MRKEVVVAIVFGIIIGLVFAFGIFRVNGVMKQKTTELISGNNSDIKKTSSEIKDANASLTLLKPDNMQVFGNDVIQITGATKANSYVIITGGTSDLIAKSNGTGSFDIEYEIDPSLNYLDVSSVSEDNTRSGSKLEVVYSSEAVKKDTAEEENLEDKIEEKLENVQNKAEFYKGTITDITDTSIQMKTDGGEIKQISYEAGLTSFAKTGKTTVKITARDIAIGDYVLALGYKTDNEVLSAFRILVTQPVASEDIKVFYGIVTKKNNLDFEISEQNSENITIEIDNNSKTYKGDLSSPEKIRFANIGNGDLVIGTYTTQKDINIARKIFLLNSN